MRPLVEPFLTWRDDEQHARFRRFHRNEKAQVILLDGGEAGWLELHETEDAAILHHFYVVPARQGQGIGTQVLRLVLEERCRDRPVRLGVLRNNPARRLYERFGFVATGEDGIKIPMCRPCGRPCGR